MGCKGVFITRTCFRDDFRATLIFLTREEAVKCVEDNKDLELEEKKVKVSLISKYCRFEKNFIFANIHQFCCLTNLKFSPILKTHIDV